MNTPFIVAEMSANHLGSLARAEKIVIAAADAGADAIKFQTWSEDTMCIDPTQTIAWGGKRVNMMELYRAAWTPWKWHKPLFDLARQIGLVPFSAAFDRGSVDFLETLNVDRHKVASFELTDLPLIRYMASKGKPMILSTGMATSQEIRAAVHACVQVNESRRHITLLKCTSAYPAEPKDANLPAMQHNGRWLATRYGLSDHSLGIGVAVAAAALGATMIEKHLTLSRAEGGPDAAFSMEPHEFKQMVTECRRAAAAIGEVKYAPGPNESTALRRSLWVSKDLVPGHPLVLGKNVVSARPALGLPPSTDLSRLFAQRYAKAGEPLTDEMVGGL